MRVAESTPSYRQAGCSGTAYSAICPGVRKSVCLSRYYTETGVFSCRIDDYAGDDHGATDAVASDLLGDISDLPGRIDNAGDVDRFRIASPEALPDVPRDTVFAAAANAATERHILRLTHFAFGMDAIVRVTTSSGTKEYATGPLAYDAYWILPLDLAAGEVVTVDVQHKNGQSAAGQYDISFGKPLLGEPAGATLYLLHVRR